MNAYRLARKLARRFIKDPRRLSIGARSAPRITNNDTLDYNAPLLDNVDEVTKRIRRRYRSLFLTFPNSKRKTKRLLDKAPSYLAFWSLIEYTFPDAQYIICLRDPRWLS